MNDNASILSNTWLKKKKKRKNTCFCYCFVILPSFYEVTSSASYEFTALKPTFTHLNLPSSDRTALRSWRWTAGWSWWRFLLAITAFHRRRSSYGSFCYNRSFPHGNGMMRRGTLGSFARGNGMMLHGVIAGMGRWRSGNCRSCGWSTCDGSWYGAGRRWTMGYTRL